MRIRNTRKFNQEEFIRPIAISNGFKVITCSSKKEAETNNLDFIASPTDKPTLVFIFGKYRMGQRIIKDNITAVFEYSEGMHSDTALQGLLGRSCGYHTSSYPIYMPQHIIDITIPEYIKFIDTKGATGISNAMNTKRIHPNSPINYPQTTGREIFGMTITPKENIGLTIHTNLKCVGKDYYGGFYEIV